MIVKEVMRFETVDGALHATREEAEAHASVDELFISLRGLLDLPPRRDGEHFSAGMTIQEAKYENALFQIAHAIATKHADKARAIADILGGK